MPGDAMFARCSSILEEAVAAQTPPGAAACIVTRGRVVFEGAYGFAALQPEPISMTRGTRFDLASLTKPLVTAALVGILADEKVIALSDDVSLASPELAVLSQRVSWQSLLSHTSGLPAWYPFYIHGTGGEEIVKRIAEHGLANAPGSRVDYSDVGFALAGVLIERMAGMSLSDLFSTRVARPMSLTQTGFLLGGRADLFASTERGNMFERQMLARAGLRYADWRTSFYPGQPNDGNAHYALGDVSGHAGLFGTAREVALLADGWLRARRGGGQFVISTEMAKAATSVQTKGLNASRGLGWDGVGPVRAVVTSAGEKRDPYLPPAWRDSSRKLSPYGTIVSSDGFGHCGFTGTSVLADPRRDTVVSLMTNWIHPIVHSPRRLNILRAEFNDAALSAADASR